MADSVEILIDGNERAVGAAAMLAVADGARVAGMKVKVSSDYVGRARWLCLWGVGDAHRNVARSKHIQSDRPVACWDLGYFGVKTGVEKRAVRVSIDHDHPWRLFDATAPDPTRWEAEKISLRNNYDPSGKVLVIGMGRKSREYLKLIEWEKNKLEEAKRRFPDRQVMYRPKLSLRKMNVPDKVQWRLFDGVTPIEKLLPGTSLVICRHSNVAVDACIGGVPVECDEGAAYWLYRNGTNPSEDQRLDFLYRLAWWQWRFTEMRDAWRFLLTVCA